MEKPVKKFSPERLAHIRRLRKARRLFKKSPLFAYQWMAQDYPYYRYDEFLDDLRRRSAPKVKRSKSPLIRYGRYWRIDELLRAYSATKDVALVIKANKLRQNITKPYRVLIRLNGKEIEYTLSPLIPITTIEQLMPKLHACTIETEVEAIMENFNRYSTSR